MSDDGTKILAVIGLNDFYVWEMDATEVLFSANQAGLQGTWSRVYSDGTSLPGNQAKGATCDATFFISEVSVVSPLLTHVNHIFVLYLFCYGNLQLYFGIVSVPVLVPFKHKLCLNKPCELLGFSIRDTKDAGQYIPEMICTAQSAHV